MQSRLRLARNAEAAMDRMNSFNRAPLDEPTLKLKLAERAQDMREHIATLIRARVSPGIDSDDVLEEVFATAFCRMNTYHPAGPDAFDRWLAAIVNHKVLDALKGCGRLKRRGGDQHQRLSGVWATPASPGRTPSGECAAREAAEAAQEAINRLAENQQAAVRMRFKEGLSVKEIACRMHKSEAAVGSLLFRGLLALRRQMGSAARYFSATD